MKTLLLYLAGIGGLLIILCTIGNVMALVLSPKRNSEFITWNEMEEIRKLWGRPS